MRRELTQAVKDATFDLAGLANTHLQKVYYDKRLGIGRS